MRNYKDDTKMKVKVIFIQFKVNNEIYLSTIFKTEEK